MKSSFTNLNNLVAGKLQGWDVHCIASHQITVEDAKNRFVSDDKKIILLALKLKDDWFKADCQIMVGLFIVSSVNRLQVKKYRSSEESVY